MSDDLNVEKLTCFSLSDCYYGQKKLIKLRKEVNRRYFLEGFSKNTIASMKRVSKHFVIKWTQSPFQDFEEDQRGWPMGRPRKWNNQTKERIAEFHQQIKDDPRSFYWAPLPFKSPGKGAIQAIKCPLFALSEKCSKIWECPKIMAIPV